MAHQKALALSDVPRKTIQSNAQNAQQRFTNLQRQLSAATEKLVTLLGATHVEQVRAIAALDAVLASEKSSTRNSR